MKLQDNVRAVVVKEVQLRGAVLTGALHCCSRASPSTSSPTFNCPLSRLRRPPADLNAATTDKDCDPSGSRSSADGLWGQDHYISESTAAGVPTGSTLNEPELRAFMTDPRPHAFGTKNVNLTVYSRAKVKVGPLARIRIDDEVYT